MTHMRAGGRVGEWGALVGEGEWERESGEWECRRSTLGFSRQRAVHLPGYTHVHLPVYTLVHGHVLAHTLACMLVLVLTGWRR